MHSSSTHSPPLFCFFLCRFRRAARADSRASSCRHLCRKLLFLFQKASYIFLEITSPRRLYRRRLPQDDLQDICKERRDFLLQERAFSGQVGRSGWKDRPPPWLSSLQPQVCLSHQFFAQSQAALVHYISTEPLRGHEG